MRRPNEEVLLLRPTPATDLADARCCLCAWAGAGDASMFLAPAASAMCSGVFCHSSADCAAWKCAGCAMCASPPSPPPGPRPPPGPQPPPWFTTTPLPTGVEMPSHNYAALVRKTLLFFRAQRSGDLEPSGNPIPYRSAPSFMSDGADVGVDLSRGYVRDLVSTQGPLDRRGIVAACVILSRHRDWVLHVRGSHALIAIQRVPGIQTAFGSSTRATT